MPGLFDVQYAHRLRLLRERLLPLLKHRPPAMAETPSGSEETPEPESPRPYSPGDDARAIDWNLFARLDRLFVKTMTREEAVPALLLVDVSASMAEPYPQKLQQALAMTAALADLSLALGHPVGIVPWARGPQQLLGPYTGEGELESIFLALGSLVPGGVSDLSATLSGIPQLRDYSHARVIVLSDFLFPADYGRDVESLLFQGFGVQAVQIIDDEEADYPLRGNLILVDPESGREAGIQADQRLLRRYRKLFAAHQAAVREIFVRAGAPLVVVRSGEPFELATEQFFRTRPQLQG